MTFQFQNIAVRYLLADCGVRYWEDAKINGKEDDQGSIPLRQADRWRPVIDIESGVILNWPEGVVADLHYKVCDDGAYSLLDADMKVVVSREGYVPDIMSPDGKGYGDYVVMKIDGAGKIDRWSFDLSYWER